MECNFSKQIPILEMYDIHLWIYNLSYYSERVNEFAKILSKDELERANKYRFREHHDRFVLFRGCQRLILAKYLEIDPTKINFIYNHFGKPILEKPVNTPDISFNQSHTFNLGLLAITKKLSIGVDIERIRDDFPYENIVQNNFTKNELFELKKMPQTKRKEAFYNFWTLKEAFLKATGCGLSIPLDSIDVSVISNEGFVKIQAIPYHKSVSDWTLKSLNLCEGYSVALALQYSIKQIFFLDFRDYF